MAEQLAAFIEQASKYSRVLVSGPQRSGTRITAKIMAHELGYPHVDETDINIYSLSRIFDLFASRPNFVLNCPALSSCIHLIDTPNTIVLFMMRDTAAIQKSEQRIGWGYYAASELARYFRQNGIIAEIKYDCWNKFQKPTMQVPFIEFPYTALTPHNMFREERTHFRWNQTE